MLSIRAGMGLGDAIYLQSVVRHLTSKGDKIEVRTAWPDVFKALNGSVKFAPFSRAGQHVVAHYTSRKGIPGTTQFEDMCINAGIRGRVEMRMDWKVQNEALIDKVKMAANGKPIILVQLPRAPMSRKDSFGATLLPSGAIMQKCLDALRERAFSVQIGSGQCLHQFGALDMDLSNQTSVTDVLDLGFACSGLFGYVSFFVPLAESFGKPAFFVWSAKGLRDSAAYIRSITPEKILHRKDLDKFIIDDASDKQIKEAVNAFHF